MSDAPENDPNKSQPDDHRDNPGKSLGVGDAIEDRRPEPAGERDSPLNDDMAPPGIDSAEDQRPE